MKDLVVVALGGNAVLRQGQEGSFEDQVANLRRAAGGLASLIAGGFRVAITHGNGPQVGSILIQNEMAKSDIPAMPLSACGAKSQGLIGFMCQMVLDHELSGRGLSPPVATVVTRVAVDPEDPAFSAPTKPIGLFYGEAEARSLEAERGYVMREDARRGWRRVVPSPEPQEILELDAIRTLVDSGALVIAAGGGGIPVDRSGRPVDAVIDKDLTAALMARGLGAGHLVILTDVPAVAVRFGRSDQAYLGHMTAGEAERLMSEGHFPPGSMGPKMEAAVRFARTGGTAVISSLDLVVDAVRGEAGTRITAG